MRWYITDPVSACLIILASAVACIPTSVPAAETAGLNVTTSSDRNSAYSNEQILVTVRIEVDSNAFSVTGDPLRLADATVLSLNKISRKGTRNGLQTVVTERLYAVFSTQVGTLEIPALGYQAQLPVSANNDGRKTNPTLQASSRALSIDILAPPASVNTWFPATSVALQSDWGRDRPAAEALTPGEAVDINISIKVTGQHPAAIPALLINTSSNLRSYPATPAWEDYQSKLGFGGTLTQKVTVVAADRQQAYIEQLVVPWWDINARQWRTARLARQPLAFSELTKGGYAADKTTVVVLAGVLLSLLAALVVTRLTLSGTPLQSEKSAWRSVKRAVKKHDAEGTRSALLAWCQWCWPGVRIAGAESAALQDASLARVFQQLEKSIYSAEATAHLQQLEWEGISHTLTLVRRAVNRRDPSDADCHCLYPSPRA